MLAFFATFWAGLCSQSYLPQNGEGKTIAIDGGLLGYTAWQRNVAKWRGWGYRVVVSARADVSAQWQHPKHHSVKSTSRHIRPHTAKQVITDNPESRCAFKRIKSDPGATLQTSTGRKISFAGLYSKLLGPAMNALLWILSLGWAGKMPLGGNDVNAKHTYIEADVVVGTLKGNKLHLAGG